MRETKTDLVVPGDAYLMVFDSKGKPFSQYNPDANGMVVGKLEPGNYSAYVVCDNRPQPERRFHSLVTAGHTTAIPGTDGHTLTVPQTATVPVFASESADSESPHRPLPTKVIFQATAPANAANDGLLPRKFLYDLSVGDRDTPHRRRP